MDITFGTRDKFEEPSYVTDLDPKGERSTHTARE